MHRRWLASLCIACYSTIVTQPKYGDNYYRHICPIHGDFLFDKSCTDISEVCCPVPHLRWEDDNTDEFDELDDLNHPLD